MQVARLEMRERPRGGFEIIDDTNPLQAQAFAQGGAIDQPRPVGELAPVVVDRTRYGEKRSRQRRTSAPLQERLHGVQKLWIGGVRHPLQRPKFAAFEQGKSGIGCADIAQQDSFGGLWH
jgi:hypothetical protein